MTCPTCGKEQKRPHWHGKGETVRYGKFVAQLEREWIRNLIKRAKST